MTKIIAILLLVGQFQATVVTSSGRFVATYADTDAGVAQFLRAIRKEVASEPGRFYPCLVHDKTVKELLASPIVLRIGPGTAQGPSVIAAQFLKAQRAQHGNEDLTASLAEKVCLSRFPPDYMTRHTTLAGVREFYRPPPRPADAQITQIGACEVIVREL